MRGFRAFRQLSRPLMLRAAGMSAAATLLSSATDAMAEDCPSQGVSAEPCTSWHRTGELPIFSNTEVARHRTVADGVWVTFRGGVYDITQFIENHPGGVEKIMTAAGQSVEPFWQLYRQHLQPVAKGSEPVPKDHVASLLAPMQIGWLDPVDAAATAAAQRSDDDPYRSEPKRHPALRLLSETPCSGESPSALMAGSWTTPNELFFVRNHHPVPLLDPESFALEVRGPNGAATATYTMEQLRAMPSVTVTASLQCGGNRRGELNSVRPTSGNAWGLGAISNASWTGVPLRDILKASGLATEAEQAGGVVQHVHFEGADGTKASIPVEKATSLHGDVLVAYEMNGEPLPPDHGFPLRAIVPGHVGVRNIKWLQRVVASAEEASGVWQRGIAYKTFGPDVTKVDGLDISKYAPIQEMPVQSAILSPLPQAVAEAGEVVNVQGFAWSGGGRGIVRVDVSGDDGATWVTATLGQGSQQPLSKAWAWTFWEAEVPVLTAGPTKLVCKAVDASHNTQPETAASVWNLRGLANNSWHRVPLVVKGTEEE